MIPKAGRRRGQAPSSMPPPDSQPSMANEPEWLFVDSEAPVAAKTTSHPPTTTKDTLSFLDFDDAPLPLVAPSSSTYHDLSSSKPHVVTSSASLRNRLEEIQAELQRVEEERLRTEEHIKLLEGGEDASCLEVKELGEEIFRKREEEKRVTAAHETLELQRYQHQEQQQRIQGETDVSGKQELAESLGTLRAQYEEEVNNLDMLLERQKNSISELEDRRNAMSNSISATQHYEGSLFQLQEVLKGLLHSMTTSVCSRARFILMESIRDAVAQSAQIRQEILANDRRRRCDQLGTWQHTMNKKFSEFSGERRARHQTRLDLIFSHATMKARSDLETRLTESRQHFVESQRFLTTEAHRCTDHVISKMVRRSEEDLTALENRLREEVRHAEERCASELAHHARVFVAERETTDRRHSQFSEEDLKRNEDPVFSDVLNKLRFFQEHLKQLAQSTSLNIQELSVLRSQPEVVSFSVQEKEVLLAECKQKTQRLKQQLDNQWERFRAAVAPLEQCVNSMASGFREGRLKASAMQQGVDCVYRTWIQDVRRELSSCLRWSGASCDSGELHGSVVHMTRVVEEMLAHLQSLMAVLKEVRIHRMNSRSAMDQNLVVLATQHTTFSEALHSVFDEYERLSRVAAEVEQKRNLLEVAESDYAAAKRRLEKEKNKFNERLKVAQYLSENLRRDTEGLNKKAVHRGCRGSCLSVLPNMGHRSTHCKRSSYPKAIENDEEETLGLQVPVMGAFPSSSISMPPVSPSPSIDVADGDKVAIALPTDVDIESSLNHGNRGSRTPDLREADRYINRRRSHGSECAMLSNRVSTDADSRSITTPSISN